MFIVFNILVLGLIALIAYWWANQGVFSALLHLLCVLLAGAIAFALWEPLTYGVLLRGGAFDNFAWGTALVVLFIVPLLLFRVVADRLCPANVNLPHWANLVFGGALGWGAGTITIGILLIGAGFIQSRHELLGYHGAGRSSSRAAAVVEYSPGMWYPAHKLTTELYGMLSVGSLSTTTPLRHYNPKLHMQASLVRDSFDGGKGALALKPDDAEVRGAFRADQPTRYIVHVNFKAGSRDFGEQLTLSRSQIRLLGDPSGSTAPYIEHPDRWTQDSGHYGFDDLTHYVTTAGGREFADVYLEFPWTSDQIPRFIQIRNTRYELPASIPAVSPAEVTAMRGGARVSSGGPGNPSTPPASFAGARPIDDSIFVSNSISPVVTSSNMLPSGIKEIDKLLTEGVASFPKGGPRPARTLMIKGIYAPPGTRIVQLDVSRSSAADIFDQSLRSRVPGDAWFQLVDSGGNAYSPIGYLHIKPDGVDIRLEPGRLLRTADDLPVLPNNTSHTLKLVFTVTTGSTIVGFRYGDVMVGTCSLEVPPA